jgi:hypothetical protein
MPYTYGDPILDSARSVVSTLLNALEVAMGTGGILPAFAAVYDTHWQEVAPAFPSVSIGFGVVATETDMGNAGPVEQFKVTCSLRVYTAPSSGPAAYRDEPLIARLVTSLINYLEERRKMGTVDTYEWRLIGEFRAVLDADFPNVRAIGATLEFGMKTWTKYTAA